MKTSLEYWRVVYTCPYLQVQCVKYFAKDEVLACQHFVGELQKDGCDDVRVHRPDA